MVGDFESTKQEPGLRQFGPHKVDRNTISEWLGGLLIVRK